MVRSLIAKLEQFGPLAEDEKRTLRDAVRHVERFSPRDLIMREGHRPDAVHLVVQGWAARYKDLADGRRQIMALLVPGDLCDVQVTLLTEMDHSIGALTPAKVATFAHEDMGEMLRGRTMLSKALWWSTMVDEAILREWLVSMGQRPADRRLGHLLCELLYRLRAVGLADEDSFDLPLTQEQLADTLGMSAVHANRTLQSLRADGVISLEGKRLAISDLERLIEFAGFDPKYLHQIGRREPRPTLRWRRPEAELET